MVWFFPMVVEAEIVRASPAQPFLATGIAIDLNRITDVLVRLDRIDSRAVKPRLSIRPVSLPSL